jgi:hypothetical protein
MMAPSILMVILPFWSFRFVLRIASRHHSLAARRSHLPHPGGIVQPQVGDFVAPGSFDKDHGPVPQSRHHLVRASQC